MFLPIGDNVDRRDFPYIPAALIIINVFVFAYEIRLVTMAETEYVAQQNTEEFFETFALTPKLLMEGQVLGLMTHMFLHGSISHILGNMIVLWAFSLSLEIGMGRAHLLGFYILWGLIGGITHAFMDYGSEIPLVGASGAIAGVMGAYTVCYGFASRIKALIFVFFRPFVVEIPAVVFGMGWFAMQIWEASNDPSGEMSGIAWGAHIGGFASGAITMLIFKSRTNQYLVEVNGKLEFRKREFEEVEGPGRPNGQAVLESLPAPCPYCNETIPDSDENSGPLVRCMQCRGLVFFNPAESILE